jgi:hypothetical protein
MGMKFKLLLSALLNTRNLGILLLGLGAGIGLLQPYLPFPGLTGPLAGVVVYLFFVIQSLTSGEFHEKFNHKQKIKKIQDLNYTSLKLANEAKKHTNTTYYQKLKRVMDDKNDIVESFFRGEKSFLKGKIVEQTLSLVISYIRLLTNFCIRSKELSEVDIGEVTNRININMRKLNFMKDSNTIEEMKRLIEMDEKIIGRLKDEKQDLERISAKLDYMESTVNMFKHQIISSIESEEMLETLETAVNEAAALDSVLEDRRKNRARI